MRRTPFPTNPSDVVALTVPDFACALDLSRPVSLDSICQRFVGDTNRALVWFTRFQALTAWCERTDVGVWLQSAPSHTQRLSARRELRVERRLGIRRRTIPFGH